MDVGSNVHIVDLSAVTSAGATTAVAMAAARVGFACMSIDYGRAEPDDEEAFTTNVAGVTTLETKRSGARAWELLEAPAEQVALGFDRERPV
jgi:hypothetical protein